MKEYLWYAWPWLTLIIFTMLMKQNFQLSSGQWLNPYPYPSPDQTGERVWFLLLTALMMAASICVLLGSALG